MYMLLCLGLTDAAKVEAADGALSDAAEAEKLIRIAMSLMLLIVL